MSRDELLKTLDAEFADLLRSFEGLSDEAMTQVWFGDWGVKDILAHVAGWQREMTQALERMARGERPVAEGVDYSDPDPWNARFAAAQRMSPVVEVVDELTASKEAFVAAARQLPEDRFEEGRAAHRILHATAIDHYREHAPQIKAWREKERV